MKKIIFAFAASLLQMSPALAETVKTLTNAPVVDPGASLFKVMVGLLLVIATIFASAWFFKRFNKLGPGYTEHLRIVASLSVGSREKILLVQVGEEQLVLGVTNNQINCLHRLEEPLHDALGNFERRTSSKSKAGADISPLTSRLNSVISQLKAR